jgi:hypothetical protein
MLAARHYDGKIQVSPYYNIDKEQRYLENGGEDWPVLNVEENEEIIFSYYATTDSVYASITYRGNSCSHGIDHSGISRYQKEINFWAGGSVPPVASISILKYRE